MVIGMVENVFTGMRRENGGNIHCLQRCLRIGAVDHGFLIIVFRAFRQNIRIKLRCCGDDCQRHRDAGIGERIRRLHGALECVCLRCSERLDQTVSDAEEYAVVLLFSLRKLRARFCLDPYIPSGKLVAAIGFKARGKGTGK